MVRQLLATGRIGSGKQFIVSSGLAINGALQLGRINTLDVPFTIDATELLTTAIPIGLALTALLVVVALFSLGRSARTHMVLVELLVIGMFGTGATTFAALRDANIYYDNSPPAMHDVRVLSKYISRSRRSRSYYVHLDDWRPTNHRIEVKVSVRTYNLLRIGDTVRLTVREGFLAYPWVERMTR